MKSDQVVTMGPIQTGVGDCYVTLEQGGGALTTTDNHSSRNSIAGVCTWWIKRMMKWLKQLQRCNNIALPDRCVLGRRCLPSLHCVALTAPYRGALCVHWCRQETYRAWCSFNSPPVPSSVLGLSIVWVPGWWLALWTLAGRVHWSMLLH